MKNNQKINTQNKFQENISKKFDDLQAPLTNARSSQERLPKSSCLIFVNKFNIVRNK